ncbi:uncharacterized protein EV420DRAFT_1570270 [Desarmillaria tabescens]|uniref:Uncharacterized protein n=1 Tax=Armillaria tabescens TaxID=1929756 RepID=A0AA39JRE6_ARMTA|nr:uncharacterized protein EV420DRAFT_1570270 [Desarmillaria tabescens]KAK0446595.1 hypothetical protein EV420DRAFT_1570270 [Desarmillaria tabescens]
MLNSLCIQSFLLQHVVGRYSAVPSLYLGEGKRINGLLWYFVTPVPSAIVTKIVPSQARTAACRLLNALGTACQCATTTPEK